jgi:hypothetical protein
MTRVNRLIVFRDGAIHATFIDGYEAVIDVHIGDLLTDGLLWYERATSGERLLDRDDPRIGPLLGLVPEDTNKGWFLAKSFAGSPET